MRKFFLRTVRGPALVAATLFFLGDSAAASQYPTFTLDLDRSSVSVGRGSCSSNCGVDAGFTRNGTVSHTYDHEGEVWSLSNLIDWTVNSHALRLYDITVDLLFTSPDEVNSENAGQGLFKSFSGFLSGGLLTWYEGPKEVAFDQGSKLDLWLQSGVHLGLGSSVETGLYLKAKDLAAMETPSPVPLPPALPALVALLAAMLYRGRRHLTGHGGHKPA